MNHFDAFFLEYRMVKNAMIKNGIVENIIL